MKKPLEEGRCKSIGLGNYMIPHLEELLNFCKFKNRKRIKPDSFNEGFRSSRDAST